MKWFGVALVLLASACSQPYGTETDAEVSESVESNPADEPRSDLRLEWVETEYGRQGIKYYSTGEVAEKAFFRNGRLEGIEHYDKAGRVKYATYARLVFVADVSDWSKEKFALLGKEYYINVLEKVYVRGNPHLDASAIDVLLAVPKLEEVHIADCPNIPAEALDRLKRERPKLKFEP